MAKSGIVGFFTAAVLLSAQTADKPFAPLEFMVGKWKGGGTGEPGAGQGAFSFLPELNGQILVRRSFNQLASGPRHEDLMIVYLDDKTPRAIYFDTEGHTIRYNVSFPAKNTAVFESSEPAGYRLTYVLDGKNLNGRFEVGGKTYLTWTTVKE
jgi:hypothetical protein